MPALDPHGTNRENPWVLLKADSGDVVVHAMCVPVVGTQGLQRKGESTHAGARAIVEMRPGARSSKQGHAGDWSVWIAWRAHARLVELDRRGICLRCGHLIVDAAVDADGMIFIGH